MNLDRGPKVSLYDEHSFYSKLNFDELGRIYLYLKSERLKYLNASPSVFASMVTAYRPETGNEAELKAQYDEMHFVCLALEEAGSHVLTKMTELEGEDAVDKFWDDNFEYDPHIGCPAHPMCDESPLGCIVRQGIDNVEWYGCR